MGMLSRLFGKQDEATTPAAGNMPKQAEPHPPAPMGADVPFAVDLYKLLSHESKENLLFSPNSIALALGMAHLGARGRTREQIELGLRWDSAHGDMQEHLASLATSLEGAHSAPPGVSQERWSILRIANSLWSATGLEMRPKFLSQVDRYYAGKF